MHSKNDSANNETEAPKIRYTSPEKRQQMIDDLRLIKQNNNIIMEYRKIANLLDNVLRQPPKFKTENWVEINDESRGRYSVNRQINFKTPIVRSRSK